MASSSTVSTRLNKQELALIQSLAELEGCDRATLIKSLLRKGMTHLRREQAVRAFRREEVTLSKAHLFLPPTRPPQMGWRSSMDFSRCWIEGG